MLNAMQEDLMAIKSFCIGRSLICSPQQSFIVTKINAAIQKLEALNCKKAEQRKVFYMLILATYFQSSKKSISIREQTKAICDKHNILVFDTYIKLIAKADDIGEPSTDMKQNAFMAMNILGLLNLGNTARNKHFLERVTLKAIMIKHDVWQ